MSNYPTDPYYQGIDMQAEIDALRQQLASAQSRAEKVSEAVRAAERLARSSWDARCAAEAQRDAAIARAEKAEAEVKWWISQYHVVNDERASSFDYLAKRFGGVGLTAYQPEMDMAIGDHIDAALARIRDLEAALGEIAAANILCTVRSLFDDIPVVSAKVLGIARAALRSDGGGEGKT